MSKYYIVVEHQNIEQLIIEVESWLNDGYTLQGGVALAISRTGDILYCQALTKEVPE